MDVGACQISTRPKHGRSQQAAKLKLNLFTYLPETSLMRKFSTTDRTTGLGSGAPDAGNGSAHILMWGYHSSGC
jgi:hypothetical protein